MQEGLGRTGDCTTSVITPLVVSDVPGLEKLVGAVATDLLDSGIL